MTAGCGRGRDRLKRATGVASLALLIWWFAPGTSLPAEYRRDGPFVGKRQTCRAGSDDSLPEIARRYDVGFDAMTAANPGVDPFVPEPRRRIVIPTRWILPDVALRRGLVINLAEMRLYRFPGRGSRTVTTFPVGIGDEGSETPVGTFRVIEKIVHPAWHVPESIRKAEPGLPAVVPPGPDNPMGSRALRLSLGTILIHGTNRPWGIGTRDSHGCIRLYEEDIVRLFRSVDRGTPVTIVNQPVKAAARAGRVYVQVHDYGDGADLYAPALRVLDAKGLAGRVDLRKLAEAVRERSGLLVDISRR